jgi:hypothetical protein
MVKKKFRTENRQEQSKESLEREEREKMTRPTPIPRNKRNLNINRELFPTIDKNRNSDSIIDTHKLQRASVILDTDDNEEALDMMELNSYIIFDMSDNNEQNSTQFPSTSYGSKGNQQVKPKKPTDETETLKEIVEAEKNQETIGILEDHLKNIKNDGLFFYESEEDIQEIRKLISQNIIEDCQESTQDMVLASTQVINSLSQVHLNFENINLLAQDKLGPRETIPGFVLYNIVSDGNCMYNAIIAGLNFLPLTYTENIPTTQILRNLVATYINTDFERYKTLIDIQLCQNIKDNNIEHGYHISILPQLKKLRNEYLNDCQKDDDAEYLLYNKVEASSLAAQYTNTIRENQVWGDEVELGVIADLLKIQIVVHQRNTGNKYINQNPLLAEINLHYNGDHYNLLLNAASSQQSQVLYDEDDIGGTSNLIGLPLKLQDILVNTELLGIEVLYTLPPVEYGSKYLLIDSDANIREYNHTIRNDIEIIYQNTQHNTASCGDNALIYSKSAKLHGINVSILIQHNHAVALIKYSNDKYINREEVLDKLLIEENIEEQDTWEIYKNTFVGENATPFKNVFFSVEHLMQYLNGYNSLKQTLNFINEGLHTLQLYANNRVTIISNFVESFISELGNIIPSTLVELMQVFKVLEWLENYQQGLEVSRVSRFHKYPYPSPDDEPGFGENRNDLEGASGGHMMGGGNSSWQSFTEIM